MRFSSSWGVMCFVLFHYSQLQDLIFTGLYENISRGLKPTWGAPCGLDLGGRSSRTWPANLPDCEDFDIIGLY